MNYLYSNKFGEVTLEPVTDFMPVSAISQDKTPETNTVLVSIEQAEQITLITENRRAYMSFCFPLQPEDKACFALQYSCPNRAVVCRMTIKDFKTPNNLSAQAQIEDKATVSC